MTSKNDNTNILTTKISLEHFDYLQQHSQLHFSISEYMRFLIIQELQSLTVYIDFISYLFYLQFTTSSYRLKKNISLRCPGELHTKITNFITNIQQMNYSCTMHDFYRFIIDKQIHTIQKMKTTQKQYDLTAWLRKTVTIRSTSLHLISNGRKFIRYSDYLRKYHQTKRFKNKGPVPKPIKKKRTQNFTTLIVNNKIITVKEIT